MLVLLDLARLFGGVTLLSFAAWTDWRWRRAPNILWWIMAGYGLVILALGALLDRESFVANWRYLIFPPVFAALIYGFWWFGLIAGGADAKALMALGVLLPFPLLLGASLPLLPSPLPGGFVVLGDSLLAFLAIPLSTFVLNLARGHLRFPHMFLGVKVAGADVRRSRYWPMELPQADGSRRSKLFASRMSESEIEETFERVHTLGQEKIWVTPKVPFMVPLLLGFVAAFTLGDVLLWALRAAMGR